MAMEYYVLTVGVIFLLIELLIPGFGIFGIAGTLCLSWSGYYLLGGGMTALSVILGFYLLLAVGIAVLCLYLPRESKWNPFVLWDKQSNSKGYTGGSDLSAFVGLQGVALTALRPAGTVLVEGQRLDVSSLGDYIPKNAQVRIVKTEGSKIFVDRVKE
ncbi:NfeD family protein [uncultured Phascolarctobacterium sp.]|uniref:NfeD family protein n=1 Tax=uncultured Phascolarctobacterium sp. TaxID=512296 RepID=UPI0025DC4378|nr:NfeD family protein [uncultured Phascolarctobacterium sp.]